MHDFPWPLRFDPLLLSLFPPDEEEFPPTEANDDVEVLFLKENVTL